MTATTAAKRARRDARGAERYRTDQTSEPEWVAGEITYDAAIRRLRRTYGRAADQPCSVAGCDRPGASWKLWLREGPSIRTEQRGCAPDGTPLIARYSSDPRYYEPRCETHRRG